MDVQVTDESGRFTFTNVGAGVDVQVNAKGFGAVSASFGVVGDMTRDFVLPPYEPASLDLTGDWTVSLSASRTCRARLPSIARERKYAASMRQESSQLHITLTSPTLSWRHQPPGSFRAIGSLLGQRLDVGVPTDIEGTDPSAEFELHDEVGPDQVLGLIGLVSGASTSREVTASLSGFLIFRDLARGTSATCDADDHEMLFKR